MGYRLLSVNLSEAAPGAHGDHAEAVALRKSAVVGDVRVELLGLSSGERADLRRDESISKAVYAYPHEHYATWQTMRAQAQAAPWNAILDYGSLGEHLSIEGLTEAQVFVGDVLRFPGCQLAVSEPGMPDPRLDAALGFAQASQMMIQSGWCGFFLAVRSGGTIAADETFELIPGPRHISIAERFAVMTGRWSKRR